MATDNRGTCWSVTINNPVAADHEEIARARQKGWSVDGQVEKGEEGTVHLQLMVKTPQVRFSAVKKQFSRGHIELARNPKALSNYVNKADTAVAPLPTGSDRYPSLSKYWELIAIQLNNGHREWTADDKEAFFHPELVEEGDGRLPQRVYLYNDRDDTVLASDPLSALDHITEELIADGYHVEAHATNPAVRSSFRKWWRAILFRAMETVRQTDSVVVPTTNVAPEEHNQLNADDHARTQATSGVLEGLDQSEDESEPCSEEAGTDDTQSDEDDC